MYISDMLVDNTSSVLFKVTNRQAEFTVYYLNNINKNIQFTLET